MNAKLVAKFWAKVKRGTSDECWPWLGYKGKYGHGRTSLAATGSLRAASQEATCAVRGWQMAGDTLMADPVAD